MTLGRWLLMAMGLLSLGCGVVGIFVPGLPTTIFLIVASWFFARSCPGLDRWLVGHPFLGAPLRRIHRGERLPLHARLLSLLVMWIMVLFAVFRTPVGGHAAWAGIVLGAALVGTYFLTLWKPRQRQADPTAVTP